MARSSRRRGLKMPGVSTKTIWALSCVAMPRTMARVVCTLWVTIDTLAPTSWLTSVDLPALGAPISATKPERVGTGRESGRGLTVLSSSRQCPSRSQTPSRTRTAWRPPARPRAWSGRCRSPAQMPDLAPHREAADRGPALRGRRCGRPASAPNFADAPIPAVRSWHRGAAPIASAAWPPSGAWMKPRAASSPPSR